VNRKLWKFTPCLFAQFSHCDLHPVNGGSNIIWKEYEMKKRTGKKIEQPAPFTPAVTKAMVRQHAYEMFRDKLPDHPLTLEDWILAEKDLVGSMDTDNLLK